MNMQQAAPEDLEGLVFDEDSDDNIALTKLAGIGDAVLAEDEKLLPSTSKDASDEPKLLKRSKRQRPRFTETDLMGKVGLGWVQKNFPRLLLGSVKCKRGSEVRDSRYI